MWKKRAQNSQPLFVTRTIQYLHDHGAPQLAGEVSALATSLQAGPDEPTEPVANLIFACRRIDTKRGLRAMMPRVAAAFGCDHCTVHRVVAPDASLLTRAVETTYPKTWLLRYTLMSYIQVDPVLAKSEEWRDFFFWDEIRGEDRQVHRFFDDAARFGIGPAGVTDVHPVPDNGAIGVSISAPQSAVQFRETFEPRTFEFREVAEALAYAFYRSHIVGRTSGLDKDEHAFLQHIFNGGDRDGYGQLQGFDRIALERSISEKLNCASFEQALLVIGKTGLMDSPEFVLHSLTAE